MRSHQALLILRAWGRKKTNARSDRGLAFSLISYVLPGGGVISSWLLGLIILTHLRQTWVLLEVHRALPLYPAEPELLSRCNNTSESPGCILAEQHIIKSVVAASGNFCKSAITIYEAHSYWGQASGQVCSFHEGNNYLVIATDKAYTSWTKSKGWKGKKLVNWCLNIFYTPDFCMFYMTRWLLLEFWIYKSIRHTFSLKYGWRPCCLELWMFLEPRVWSPCRWIILRNTLCLLQVFQ